MDKKKLNIGILGAGHLGKIHLKCLLSSEDFNVLGIFDPVSAKSESLAKELGIVAFGSEDELIDNCDVVDIVTPTTTHFDLARKAILAQKHVFIEKPVCETEDQANELIKLATEQGVKAMVGHVERFNPAWLSLSEIPLSPMFIEGHRLASYNPRSTDVSVVLDLMIHDIDIVLQIVKSPIVAISASGVGVISRTPDIANVRLEFENGCVANLTASRISFKQMRRLRLFQQDAYVTVDFLEKKSEVLRMYDREEDLPEGSHPMAFEAENGMRYIHGFYPDAPAINAIQTELEALAAAIHTDSEPPITLTQAKDALALANRILADIQVRLGAG